MNESNGRIFAFLSEHGEMVIRELVATVPSLVATHAVLLMSVADVSEDLTDDVEKANVQSHLTGFALSALRAMITVSSVNVHGEKFDPVRLQERRDRLVALWEEKQANAAKAPEDTIDNAVYLQAQEMFNDTSDDMLQAAGTLVLSTIYMCLSNDQIDCSDFFHNEE